MQVLQKVRRERTSTRTTQQHPTFKMKLQKKVERMEAGVGMKEDRHQLQGIWRLLQMTVWGLRLDRERKGNMVEST